MSFQAMSWAVGINLPAREKIVLLMLANYASNETGDCYPSLNTLADVCGMSRSSVIRSIKILADNGIVSVNRRAQEGVNLPNYYTLNLNRVVSDRNGGGVSLTVGVVSNRDHGGVSLTPKPINDTIIEPINKPDHGFDRFWHEYPNKVGKRFARSSFEKAIKRASIEKIMAGLSRYVKKKDDRAWCNPATWLNQDRWEDGQSANTQSQEIDWSDWVLAYKSDRVWKDILGPKPDQEGCRAPITVLRENGFAS